MTPEEVGAALVAALGAEERSEDAVPVATVSGGDQWARATVDVPPAQWTTAIRTARERLGCDFFDWLSAVDELDRGYAVVAHLWSTGSGTGCWCARWCPRENPALDTIVDLFPGAAWHERETHEMFGVDFRGHPNLTPLLLPPEFEGHPLRKDFVLATRVAKPWPGAKEPGESTPRARRGANPCARPACRRRASGPWPAPARPGPRLAPRGRRPPGPRPGRPEREPGRRTTDSEGGARPPRRRPRC